MSKFKTGDLLIKTVRPDEATDILLVLEYRSSISLFGDPSEYYIVLHGEQTIRWSDFYVEPYWEKLE